MLLLFRVQDDLNWPQEAELELILEWQEDELLNCNS